MYLVLMWTAAIMFRNYSVSEHKINFSSKEVNPADDIMINTVAEGEAVKMV